MRARGYRFNERSIASRQIKPDVHITVNSSVDVLLRPPVMESIGPVILGAAPPHVDPWDQNTAIAGVLNRICAKPPQHDRAFRRRFRKFVQRWCRKNLVPLSANTDFSFENWLSLTNYPEWRKAELREAWEKCGGVITSKDKACKCFIKDETYPSFKHARAIFSRSDAFKCYAGPIFKQIENVIYSLPDFIKHVPVHARPGYIMDRIYVPGAKYAATDYTAFESHFTKHMMLDCEFVMYEYMLKNTTEVERMKEIKRTLIGKNKCLFKRFQLDLEATRMSGEMCTSLGNGFSNLMFFLFVCQEEQITCTGVVEGDDGLFVCSPKLPSNESFEKLGLTIKIEEHTNLATASFCGIIFDEVDLINVTDPLEVLVNFGWSKQHHVGMKRARKLELLKSKSLSFAYQYQGCPIIQSLAWYGLRMTHQIDLRRYLARDRSVSMWEREQMLEAMKYSCKKVKIPMNTRKLVQDKFGITIEDQIAIEGFFDAKTDLGPISFPTIDKYMKYDWTDYYDNYVGYEDGDFPWMNVPEYHGELKKYFDSGNLHFTTFAETSDTVTRVLGL